jgi:hypothetical protein
MIIFQRERNMGEFRKYKFEVIIWGVFISGGGYD